MTKFEPGDIVRITKGEPDKPGYEVQVRTVVSNVADAGEIDLDVLMGYEDSGVLMGYEDGGWVIELIERPAPPLPTKPNTIGWATYQGKRSLVRRDHAGWCVHVESGKTRLVTDSYLFDFTEAVLIPKELADRVVEWSNRDYRPARLAGDTLEQIANHLKGQDDECGAGQL